MIELFLVTEIKKTTNKQHRFLYFFDTIGNKVYALNPYTRKLQATDDSYINELYYEDTVRKRIHTRLFIFNN